MRISDLKKALNYIQNKYGDIEVRTYDEGGYTEWAKYVRVFEEYQKFYVFIGEDCTDRHEDYAYEEHIPYKEN